MKRLCVLAILISARVSLAAPSAPEAAPAADSKLAKALVQKEILEPLAAKERDQSKFSRARLPAQERRVRILDEKPRSDSQGAAFYSFAVDARHGIVAPDSDKGWQVAVITGCVYESGEAFVRVGDRHRPAAFLLGKNLRRVAEHKCKPVTVAAATAAD